MPKYYFDVRSDAGLSVDKIGTEFTGAKDVGEEIRELLVELLRSHYLDGGSGDVSVTVRDENSTPIFAGTISVDVKPVGEQPKAQSDEGLLAPDHRPICCVRCGEGEANGVHGRAVVSAGSVDRGLSSAPQDAASPPAAHDGSDHLAMPERR
jgi:hypothetical protein